MDDNEIVTASEAEKSLDLESLLAQVTTENLHAEVDMGPAVGNEEW